MRKVMPFLVLFGFAGCELSQEPEIRSTASQLQLQGQWSATIAGVGASPITGTLTVREYGSYTEAEIAVQGAPRAAYQWRIFRGGCAVNTAAQLGLHLGVQAYPDLVADAAGNASAAPTLGGSLNSPTGVYSVRLRNATSTTNWNGTNPVACGDLQRS